MIKPYFYKQADSRWAKKRYKCTDGGYASVGPAGCGPTSVANVVSALIKPIRPYTVFKYACQKGYMTSDSGMYRSAVPKLLNHYHIEPVDILPINPHFSTFTAVLQKIGGGLDVGQDTFVYSWQIKRLRLERAERSHKLQKEKWNCLCRMIFVGFCKYQRILPSHWYIASRISSGDYTLHPAWCRLFGYRSGIHYAFWSNRGENRHRHRQAFLVRCVFSANRLIPERGCASC